MTEKEFGIVEWWLREAMEYGEERHNEPYEMAIQALEEIQQYREIGTVDDILKGIKQSEEEFEMLMQYREIGTIGEIKEKLSLLEKYEELGTVEELDEVLNMFC